MSAELLRTCAALMRERAEAATPGPWISTVWPKAIPGVYSQAVEDVGKCDPEIARTLDEADATHIASWHPTVALAVAALLDTIAERWEEWQPPEDVALRWTQAQDALAIARAYLGTPT